MLPSDSITPKSSVWGQVSTGWIYQYGSSGVHYPYGDIVCGSIEISGGNTEKLKVIISRTLFCSLTILVTSCSLLEFYFLMMLHSHFSSSSSVSFVGSSGTFDSTISKLN